jgi:hypothetical protein
VIRFLTAAAVAVFAGTLGVRAQEAVAPSIALVRVDGALIPVARFRDGAWSRLLSELEPHRLLPEVVPMLRRPWSVVLEDGRRMDASPNAPTLVASHCSELEVLPTSLAAEQPRPYTFPQRIRGVAAQGRLRLERVMDVRNEQDGRTQPLRALIDRLLAQREGAALRAYLRGNRSIAPGDIRPIGPLEIRALWQNTAPERDWYYFEARRPYPDLVEPGCPITVVASGWMTRLSAQPPLLVRPRIDVTDCDGKGISSFQPAGVVVLGSQRLWVGVEYYYEGEAFILVETSLDRAYNRRLVEVYGGGC